MSLLVHHIHAQHFFQDLVCSFGLPISLRVIRNTKFKLGSQGLLETSPKSSGKHHSSIINNPLRHTMKPHNITDENSSYFRCLIRHMHRNKMSTLHQSVDYHINRVVSPCCQWKSNNEIHRNNLPFRFRNSVLL
jgi:hypothetical protein